MAQFLWYDCTFKKQCTVPVTLTFDLWKSMFFRWIYNDPISVLYEFQIDISTHSCLLHDKRRTRQKWRPIVTKLGTLIENMSRKGGVWLPYLLDFYWQFYEN